MKLADEITALTLLETADLTELLKDRLGVELPAGGFAMGAMPMAMPAAGACARGGGRCARRGGGAGEDGL